MSKTMIPLDVKAAEDHLMKFLAVEGVTGQEKAIGEAVIEELKRLAGHDDVKFIPLSLDDLGSVRAAAKQLLAMDEPIHVLINNAGLAGQRGKTKDGFEIHFGVNHLGHFLLTTLLLDRIRASAPARIVNVASRAHYNAKGIDWNALREDTAHYTGMHEYSISKLANVLFTKELARRLSGTGVTTYAIHPGVIASNIWARVPGIVRPLVHAFMKSSEEGAHATVHTATADSVAHESGKYYARARELRIRVQSRAQLSIVLHGFPTRRVISRVGLCNRAGMLRAFTSRPCTLFDAFSFSVFSSALCSLSKLAARSSHPLVRT